MKQLKNLILFICAGFILSSCYKTYIYSPNYVIIKKPMVLEMIQTEERLKQVHQMNKIIDYNFATMGSALRLQDDEIFLIKEKDLLQEYKIISLSKTYDKTHTNFFPNHIGYRYPTSVHLLTTSKEVLLIKASKNIYKNHLAEVGAAVSLSLDGEYLNLIPKNIIQKDYNKPVELRQYLREHYQIQEN